MDGGIARGEMLIDGRFVSGPDRRAVINPATGGAFAEVSLTDAAMAGEALAAARRAQPAWGARAPLDSP